MSEASPHISCVVPAYNSERFIAEALDSLLAQTLPPIEIIVVDDGSTDGTAGIVRNYGPQVVCIRQANAGPAAARNLGLDLVQGTFVAFLDADDIAIPRRLELQMERFRARPEVGVCLAHVQNFWGEEQRWEEERVEDWYRKPIPSTVTGGGLVRREVFDRHPFDTQLKRGEDQEWLLRVGEAGIVIDRIPEVVVHRRMHADSLIHDGQDSLRENMLLLVKKTIDRRRSSPPS